MIKRMLRKIMAKQRTRKIRQVAIVGENIRFGHTASCVNTGEKQNVRIGNHGFIAGSLVALYGGKISIGNNIYMGGGTLIQASEKIEIRDNVIIANKVHIMDTNFHPTSPEMRVQMSMCDDYFKSDLWFWNKATHKSVVIEDNVWIGEEAVIMKGVKIGQGSIVGMRAVVTHDVPPYTIVAGNPARIVKKLHGGAE